MVWLGIALTWVAVAAWGLWAVPPAVVLIGTFQYHLNVMGHDGLHYLLSDNRRLNDRVCRWLLHGPHGAPLGTMRRNHLNHHTRFGSETDLDRQYYDVRRFERGAAFLRWLCGTLLGGMTLPIVVKLLGLQAPTNTSAATKPTPPVAPAPAGRSLDLASVVLSQVWIALTCGLITGWWFAYLLFWALPLVTIMMGLNSIRSCLEHSQPGVGEPGLHSFTATRWERFFLAPFHMNVHAEHHLVPAVPWHQLPALRAHLQRAGDYGQVALFASYAGRARDLAMRVDIAHLQDDPLSRSK